MDDASHIKILGVKFDNITMKEAVERAVSWIDNGDRCQCVVTPNTEIVEMYADHEEIRPYFDDAYLTLPDGAGVLRAANKLGTPFLERVPGVEFGESLVRESTAHHVSLFFLGGKPGVAERAAVQMKMKYPGTVIAGTHDGYFEMNGDENDLVVETINRSGASILLVCMGAPKQEKWMYDNSARLTNIRIAAGLGGSLDVYAGDAKRAPQFFLDHGLEWLYRVFKQPSRIRRLTSIPKFLRRVRSEKRRTAMERSKIR